MTTLEKIEIGFTELKKTGKHYQALLHICGNTKFFLMSDDMQKRVLDFLINNGYIK